MFSSPIEGDRSADRVSEHHRFPRYRIGECRSDHQDQQPLRVKLSGYLNYDSRPRPHSDEHRLRHRHLAYLTVALSSSSGATGCRADQWDGRSGAAAPVKSLRTSLLQLPEQLGTARIRRSHGDEALRIALRSLQVPGLRREAGKPV